MNGDGSDDSDEQTCTRDVGCRTDQNSNLMDIGMPHGNIKLKAARYGNLGLASASGKYGKKT